MPDKPFPRRCPQCREREVYLAMIPYDAEVKHDGRLYSFHIANLSVNRCEKCNLVTFDTTTEEEISGGPAKGIASTVADRHPRIS